MDKMLARLKEMAIRYNEINEMLISGSSFSDAREYGRISKEHSKLQQPVEAYYQLVETLKHIEDAELLANDPELREMAEMELEELKEKDNSLLTV